jgi:hypothetical protein
MRQAAIAQDSLKQSRPNCLAGVNRNHGRTSVRMTKKVMTPSYANRLKTETDEGRDQCLASDP